MQQQKITKKLVERLATRNAFPSVSILMPTHKASTPQHLSEDQIRFKNNISEAKQKLESMDAPPETRKMILRKLQDLQSDKEFLANQSRGLGLFVTDESAIAVSLPYTIENHVTVSEKFHIAPLLTIIQENRAFNLLQLSDKNPRFFKGDMYSLKQLDIDMPKSKNDALNIDEFRREQQFHTGEARGRAMYHGHAPDEDHENAEQQNYFRFLSKLVKTHMDTKTPLILAGSKRDIALFRNVSKISSIAEDSIEQSIEKKRLDDIHELAQEVLQTWSMDEAYKVRAKFKQLVSDNSTKAVYDLNKIMTAAAEGRIAQLLVGIKRVTKDTIQSGVSEATVLSHEDIDAEPLDEIALSTWSQKGTIYAIDSTLMPTTAPLAAILRY